MKIFLGGEILKMYFFREQFSKCIFEEEIFKQKLKYVFDGGISKIYSVRQQVLFIYLFIFLRESNFENITFVSAILNMHLLRKKFLKIF